MLKMISFAAFIVWLSISSYKSALLMMAVPAMSAPEYLLVSVTAWAWLWFLSSLDRR